MSDFNYQIKEGSIREQKQFGRQEIVDGKKVVKISYQVVIAGEEKGFVKPQTLDTTQLEGLTGDARTAKTIELATADFQNKYAA